MIFLLYLYKLSYWYCLCCILKVWFIAFCYLKIFSNSPFEFFFELLVVKECVISAFSNVFSFLFFLKTQTRAGLHFCIGNNRVCFLPLPGVQALPFNKKKIGKKNYDLSTVAGCLLQALSLREVFPFLPSPFSWECILLMWNGAYDYVQSPLGVCRF